MYEDIAWQLHVLYGLYSCHPRGCIPQVWYCISYTALTAVLQVYLENIDKHIDEKWLHCTITCLGLCCSASKP